MEQIAEDRQDEQEPDGDVANPRYPGTPARVGAALKLRRPLYDAIRRVAAKEAADRAHRAW